MINNIYGGRASHGDLMLHNMGQQAFTRPPRAVPPPPAPAQPPRIRPVVPQQPQPAAAPMPAGDNELQTAAPQPGVLGVQPQFDIAAQYRALLAARQAQQQQPQPGPGPSAAQPSLAPYQEKPATPYQPPAPGGPDASGRYPGQLGYYWGGPRRMFGAQ